MGGSAARAHGAAGLWGALVALMMVASASGCGLWRAEIDASLDRITEGYRFSFFQWEVDHLLRKGRLTPEAAALLQAAEEPRALVEEYLSMNGSVRSLRSRLQRLAAEGAPAADRAQVLEELADLEGRHETLSDAAGTVLARQITDALSERGIRHPADRWIDLDVVFPPVWFEIAQPPHVLVVSPREEIAKYREVMLVQGLETDEMERIEADVQALGYSALVVRLGGFGGLYPALVAESSSLPFLLEAATEEWLHQYLAFTPLGFRYVLSLLHISRSYEIATLNETVAGIVSEEVARDVLATHYPEQLPGVSPPPEPADPEAFSFPREMRRIRLHVDDLLAAGEIEEAEAFMEERRRFLLTQGYYIRRLNQAYFAFHGTYAAEPTSVDPIGTEVRALRAESASLSEFLNRMVTITSRAQLREVLGIAD